MVADPRSTPLGNGAALVLMVKSMWGVGALNLAFAVKRVKLCVGISVLSLTCLLNVLAIIWTVQGTIRVRYGKPHESQPKPVNASIFHAGDSVPPSKSPDVNASSGTPSVSAQVQSEATSAGGTREEPLQHVASSACPDNWGLGPIGEVAWFVLGRPGLYLIACLTVCGAGGAMVAQLNVIVATLDDRLFHLGASFYYIRVALFTSMCVLVSMRRLKELAFVSSCACLVFLYIACTLAFRGAQALALTPSDPTDKIASSAWGPPDWSGFGACFGIHLWATEGLAVIQLIFDDMRLGRNPQPFFKVAGLAYTLCFILYLYMQVFGYLAYGDQVEQVTFFNFPDDALDTIACEAAAVVVLATTYLVNAYVIFSFLERITGLACKESTALALLSRSENDAGESNADAMREWRQACVSNIGMRILVVVVTFAVAALIPDITKIMSIVGSLCFGLYGVALPGFFYLYIFFHELTLAGKVSTVFVTLLGVVCTGFGIHASFANF